MRTVKEYKFEYSKRETIITNSHTPIVQFLIHAIAPFYPTLVMTAVDIFPLSAEIKNDRVLPPFLQVFIAYCVDN
jgi:hypothetical protein